MEPVNICMMNVITKTYILWVKNKIWIKARQQENNNNKNNINSNSNTTKNNKKRHDYQ